MRYALTVSGRSATICATKGAPMAERDFDTNRPYAPASNISLFLERIRTRNMPDRVDRDYLVDSGISENLVNRVVFALRFLGLLEGDTPTSPLRAISTSTDEEYRQILSDQLHAAYADVFAVVDPERDSAAQILNVFRKFTPGSQRERMVSFFLAMCREAGIDVLDAPRERSREASPLRTKSRSTSKGATSRSQMADISPGSVPQTSRPAVTAVAPALELLVQSLPAPGTPLPPARRQQWLTMAEATLKFLYPEESQFTVGDNEMD